MKNENMSPLRYYTIKCKQKINKKIKNNEIIIDYAMRYGNPSIKSKMRDLQKKDVKI